MLCTLYRKEHVASALIVQVGTLVATGGRLRDVAALMGLAVLP